MRLFLVLIVLIAVTASPAGAATWLDVNFRLDPCAWRATHVVVVTEGGRIDGAV